jgi:hypothetical protein
MSNLDRRKNDENFLLQLGRMNEEIRAAEDVIRKLESVNADLLAALQNLLLWSHISDDAKGQSGQLRDQARAAMNGDGEQKRKAEP